MGAPLSHLAHDELARAPRLASATLAPWGFALALATLSTALLWRASVGINWGICILCIVAALFATIRERFGNVGIPTVVACAWAVVLAFGTAVTTDGPRIGLLVMATGVLLAIALVTAGRSSLDALQLGVALTAPVAAIALVFSGIVTESGSTVRGARSPRMRSAARSALITVPVVITLVLLLAEADPVFAAARRALERVIPDDFLGRTIFFALVLAITLGAFGAVRHHQSHASALSSPTGADIGVLESRVLLAALASIEWLFVISAGISLSKNPAAVAGSGITYAEYVHRGFAQLSISATIIIGAVLVTRRSWVAVDAVARRIAIAALAGEGGMIAIASMRVVRYEEAYGFTQPRLHAQAYLVVLACVSTLVVIEVTRRARSSRLAYHCAHATLLVLAACVYWNTDAWIVRQNVDRYVRTGKLDTYYLTASLSPDATPALVSSLARLGPKERDALSSWLCASSHRRHRDERWFEWSYRATQAAKATLAWFHESQPNCAPPM